MSKAEQLIDQYLGEVVIDPFKLVLAKSVASDLGGDLVTDEPDKAGRHKFKFKSSSDANKFAAKIGKEHKLVSTVNGSSVTVNF